MHMYNGNETKTTLHTDKRCDLVGDEGRLNMDFIHFNSYTH